MAYLDVSRIASWHAHVYFDATNRDDAAKFREVVAAQFGEKVQIGRFHEREVGPHPKWSFQIAFAVLRRVGLARAEPWNARRLRASQYG